MMSKKWTPSKVTVDEEINTLRERERKEKNDKVKDREKPSCNKKLILDV